MNLPFDHSRQNPVDYQGLHYRWEWPCRANAEALWPLVANTNRFNYDTDLPSVQRRGFPDGKRTEQPLRATLMGVNIEWDEEPFEWIRPQRFGVLRRYHGGPVAELKMLAEFVPQPQGGCLLIYEVWARPRNLVGRLTIPIQLGWLSARRFEATIRRYDRLAEKQKLPIQSSKPAHFAPGGRFRLENSRNILIQQNVLPELVDRLIELIEQGDDLTLARLRPYALADAWDAKRSEVLKLFLHATRDGLLSFRWDLLCPFCRGAKQTSSSLGGIKSKVHCDSCNIDFTVDFDRSVELTFHPNHSIRHIEIQEYCIGGPEVTPHIMAQQRLPAASQRSLTLPLEYGKHRIRTLRRPGECLLISEPDAPAQAHICAGPNGWPRHEIRVSNTPTLQLENATEEEQVFILERTAWSDQVTTAAEVTALQLFRDLFANEALRPEEQISVGSLTILFTDLHESTRMYREIGDAPAFGTVMRHFDILKEAIAQNEGAIVKTIGDAVMAVFRHPGSALHAIFQIHEAISTSPPSQHPLRLKAGIHSGSCIAVNLNDRLDYFGSTVNIAARLVGQSKGGDVVISEKVRSDPEVLKFLTNASGKLSLESVEAKLKGFEAERFQLWRISSHLPS